MWLEDLYSIGEIARILEISTDTLRYYDEIGLIRPAHRHPENGYRYYSHQQLDNIVRILEWKRYGFSLQEIHTMLESEDIALHYKRRIDTLLSERMALDAAVCEMQGVLHGMEDIEMKKTVVIVDDVEFMNETLCAIVENNGYAVIGRAYDGERAVEMMESIASEFIVLDIGSCP